MINLNDELEKFEIYLDAFGRQVVEEVAKEEDKQIMSQHAIPKKVTVDMCSQSIADTIKMLRDAKPSDRSELDRRFAIVITEMEKGQALFFTYIVNQGAV